MSVQGRKRVAQPKKEASLRANRKELVSSCFRNFVFTASGWEGSSAGPVPPESRQCHEGDTWFALLQKNRFPIVPMLRPQVAVLFKK